MKMMTLLLTMMLRRRRRTMTMMDPLHTNLLDSSGYSSALSAKQRVGLLAVGVQGARQGRRTASATSMGARGRLSHWNPSLLLEVLLLLLLQAHDRVPVATASPTAVAGHRQEQHHHQHHHHHHQ